MDNIRFYLKVCANFISVTDRVTHQSFKHFDTREDKPGAMRQYIKRLIAKSPKEYVAYLVDNKVRFQYDKQGAITNITKEQEDWLTTWTQTTQYYLPSIGLKLEDIPQDASTVTRELVKEVLEEKERARRQEQKAKEQAYIDNVNHRTPTTSTASQEGTKKPKGQLLKKKDKSPQREPEGHRKPLKKKVVNNKEGLKKNKPVKKKLKKR